MKKLIETLKHIWAIEELRKRIVYTMLLLLVYRLGSFIILPGIDSEELVGLNNQTKNNILGLINTFAGGAFARGAIFALGIMPYISASILMQLVSIAIPAFQRLQKEGEEGRRKINQYTRLLTIAFTAVQAIGYLSNIANTPGNAQALLYNFRPDVMSQSMFMITNVILLTAGTMFTMWLGERITDRGLGNGISLLIMVGIIARMPAALVSEFAFKAFGSGPILFLIEMVIWFMVVLGVILLTQGTRKITINYAKRVVGNRQYGGARQYLPIKILAAGVMPIIFAQAILFLPATIGSFYGDSGAPGWLISIMNPNGFGHNALLVFLIVVFTYFYTAIIFNPVQMADDMKRNNGFIPGIKPGKQTANFIDGVISRITFPGAVLIAIVAILPVFAQQLGVNQEFSQFYGGTSLLILVGVVLDTLQQIDSYLTMRKYDGLMSGGGKLKGRMTNAYSQVDF
ncbi:MAG: preprotein translocase subunit SecY [Bacteroidetes bacterium]|nr:preprotein translocase subunit SecY [Bacteroidota bacterium]MDA0942678.1 preprotein translocase subunit SecY [Bacteroidota bacterium]MDA1111332.1 preprotein translocase subunit SecY [Bacteroidota bacterium]